jgi:hypothetical protein
MHHLRRLEAAAAAGDVPPARFRDLLREVLHTLIAMRPLVLLARRLDARARLRYQRRLLAAFAEPLRRAQSHGYVRDDFVPDDLMVLFTMVQGAAEAAGDVAVARDAVDRAIELVLDGVCRAGLGQPEAS